MTTHYHAVVWLDHREARIYRFNIETAEKTVLHPDIPTHRVHHKSGSIGAGRAPEDAHYFHAVAEAIGAVQEVLLTGPSKTKTHFVHYLYDKEKAKAKRIVGVESVDHPSDGQLLAHARAYFKTFDRTRPQRG